MIVNYFLCRAVARWPALAFPLPGRLRLAVQHPVAYKPQLRDLAKRLLSPRCRGRPLERKRGAVLSFKTPTAGIGWRSGAGLSRLIHHDFGAFPQSNVQPPD